MLNHPEPGTITNPEKVAPPEELLGTLLLSLFSPLTFNLTTPTSLPRELLSLLRRSESENFASPPAIYVPDGSSVS